MHEEQQSIAPKLLLHEEQSIAQKLLLQTKTHMCQKVQQVQKLCAVDLLPLRFKKLASQPRCCSHLVGTALHPKASTSLGMVCNQSQRQTNNNSLTESRKKKRREREEEVLLSCACRTDTIKQEGLATKTSFQALRLPLLQEGMMLLCCCCPLGGSETQKACPPRCCSRLVWTPPHVDLL